MNKAKIYPWIFAVIVISAFFLILPIGTASAKTWYVDDSGGADFTKIRDAVDVASPGDTIIVRDGTYRENVNVNRRLTIQSENRAANCIVSPLNSNDHVFEVTADYVNISGFTVTGATGYTGWYNYKAGIYLIEVEHCNITCTNASNNYYGIYLDNSSNNNITNNHELNNWIGIYLEYSCNNMLLGNNASSNEYGIWIRHSSNNNTITENNANENNGDGIDLSYSGNNTITNNNASKNHYGISLYSSNNTAIINNDASNNSFCGIGLEKSSNNTIINNNANENNEYGIWIRHSSNNNTITENTANSNNCYGIRLSYSDNNILINNNAFNNDGGISLSSSSNNLITNNDVSNNNDNGISLGSSSNNNTITNNDASNNEFGISLWFSCDNNTITENDANANNYFGIYVLNSSNNYFTKNRVNSNNPWGIYLIDNSNNNFIYLNNFMNNTPNAKSSNSTNIWNSTEKITYTYNGSTYTNYLGNYWKDYKEKNPDAEEIDGNGILDTPYSINSDKDNYPLVKPFEEYFDEDAKNSLSRAKEGAKKAGKEKMEGSYTLYTTRNTRLIQYGVAISLILVSISFAGVKIRRREKRIKEYRDRYEQLKREGYKPDGDLEEMLK